MKKYIVSLVLLVILTPCCMGQQGVTSPFSVGVNFKMTPTPVLITGASGKVFHKPTIGYELALKKQWFKIDWMDIRYESGASIFYSQFLEEEYRYEGGTVFDLHARSAVFQIVAFDNRFSSRIQLSKKLFLNPFIDYSLSYPLELLFHEEYAVQYDYTSVDEAGNVTLLSQGEISFHDRPTHILRLGAQLSLNLGNLETGISLGRSISVNPSAVINFTTYYENPQDFAYDYYLESWLMGVFVRW